MPKKPKAPPGCFWRGGTLWGRTRIKGRLYRWSLNTDNPAVARERRQAGKDAVIAERIHGDAPRTYEDALESWGIAAKESIGPRTMQRYLCSLKQIDGFVTGKRLSEINRRVVGEIIDTRRKDGVSNATIKRDLGALSSVLNHACLHQWMDSNPVLPWLRLIKERRDPITATMALAMSGPMPGAVINWRQLSLPCARTPISSVMCLIRSSRRRQSPSMILTMRGDNTDGRG